MTTRRASTADLAAYRAQRVRPPACVGAVYPDAPAPLRSALAGWLALDEGEAAPRFAAPPRLVVSPHVDYARGARAYARAARALAAAEADLFVVFGTAHQTPSRPYTLTRLDHATPLGVVPTDRPALEALLATLGEDRLLGDELVHRDEHSIELQVVLLAHVVRRPFTVLPVLCSSLAHLPDPELAAAPFLAALSRALAGRRACFVAGADLAHVGPRYGDPAPPGPAGLARIAAEDRRTLGFLAAGDAAAFHRDAVRDDARRRLCGTAPIYAALRASGAAARLLHYEQWTDGRDSVSFAAAAG